MTIPQALTIWLNQTASGVSLLSWLAYTIVGIFWINYGIVHKAKPIIMIYSTWTIMNLMVVIGAFLYG